MALREKIGAINPPPNLRQGSTSRSCGTCRNFDGKGTCTKYSYRVSPGMVCDSYTPKGAPK